MFSFWDNVQKCLNGRKLTQKWLADQAGLKRQTINNGINRTYKGKESFPGVDDAYKIAQALGVTIEYLLSGQISSHGEKISPEAIGLATQYDALDEKGKRAVQALIGSLSEEAPQYMAGLPAEGLPDAG